VIAAHLNHQLRPAAPAEAEYVASHCEAWGVACSLATVDVAEVVREEGLTLEEAGRLVRYRFFADVARQANASLVAVGHNADDQAETVLMHAQKSKLTAIATD
jgi:tRNA(Ile)-lysidine synthase